MTEENIMLVPKWNTGYVGISKKAIIRGVEVPDFGGEIKERPLLVLTDADELPYGTQNVSITTLNISSLPYTLLDIPIMLANNVSKNVSFINPYTTHTISKKIIDKTQVYIQAVLPDYIFKLVKFVRSKIDMNTREAYDEVLEVLNKYRVEMMQTHRIKCIRIPVNCTTYYYIGIDGVVEYREGDVFDTSFRKYEYMSDKDNVDYSVESVEVHGKPKTISKPAKEMRSYEFNRTSPRVLDEKELNQLRYRMGITQKMIDKNPIPIFSGDSSNSKHSKSSNVCTDGELIEFMNMYSKDLTEIELAQKCGFGWKMVGDRFIVCAFEMISRGLNEYLVEFQYGKLPFNFIDLDNK